MIAGERRYFVVPFLSQARSGVAGLSACFFASEHWNFPKATCEAGSGLLAQASSCGTEDLFVGTVVDGACDGACDGSGLGSVDGVGDGLALEDAPGFGFVVL